MVFDFDKQYYDFTLELDDAVATQQCGSTVVDFSRRTPDQFQSTSVICLSPHAVTHLNVFPLDEKYNGPYFEDQTLKSNWEVRLRMFASKYLWPTILLDISEMKQRHIDELICTIEQEEDSEYIVSNIGMRKMNKLVQMLAINPKDIVEVCEDKTAFSGQFVVFYTGWRKFSPRSKDLENPFWVGRHPFMLNPYLTLESIELLKEYGAHGVGIDSISIEHPLLATANTSSSQPTSKGGSEIHENLYCNLLSPDHAWLPLLESLLIPESVFHAPVFSSRLANIVSSPHRPYVSGIMAIFLVDSSLQHSAIPARVLFQEVVS